MTAISRDRHRLRRAAKITTEHLALGDPGSDERVFGLLDAETPGRLALIGSEQILAACRASGRR
jgi:hypothetical protein